MRAAIFDLDGTLCDIRHRLHHVRDGARDWDAFFAGIPNDEPFEAIRELLLTLDNADVPIVLCSGRPEKCRESTCQWLIQHGVPYRALYMRPDNNTRPDHVVKAQILAGLRGDGFEPFIVIDDRQSVVDMWRENGLTCLQAAPSEEAVSPSARLTLMVGPSGAGKSTWLLSDAAAAMGIYPPHVISSDQIRADLCGDFRDQSRNEQVFAAIHTLAAARLKSGLPTVIDATHLRRRDRMGAAELSKGACPVRYVVIDRPEAEKRRDAGWRAELPIDLIGRHAQTFGSQIKDILAGDGLLNVEVFDLRSADAA